MSEEWFWEGNVVRCVCNYLEVEGWSVQKIADTAKRERGPDIHARRNVEDLFIEVKGFPSTHYARGDKMGQKKRANPSTQARTWYSEALLGAILMQTAYPNATIALAFPYFVTYAGLIDRTKNALSKLEIDLYLVDSSETVTLFR